MSIASEITRLQTAKSDIKTAIENKGVTVPSNVLLDDYDTYIGQISGGGGNVKQFIVTLDADVTSGDAILTEADADIAQHRLDSNIVVVLAALSTPLSNSNAIRLMLSTNRKQGQNNTVYGMSMLGGFSISMTGYQTKASGSSNLYIAQDGSIRYTKSDTLKAGKYMILCAWE